MPSTYVMADQMLGVLRNKPALYIGLFHEAPGRDGSGGSEVDGSGYARQPIVFSSPLQGEMSNGNHIQFPQATADWGWVSGMGIWDAQGDLLWFDDFADRLNVTAGAFFILRIKDLTLIEGACPAI